jgi:hypothetical protein
MARERFAVPNPTKATRILLCDLSHDAKGHGYTVTGLRI